MQKNLFALFAPSL